MMACLSATFVTGVAGCASAGGGNPFEGGVESDQIQVTVRNEGFERRNVSAYWEDGSDQFLGVVPGGEEREFTIRFRSYGIRFSGGPREFTAVYPGDRLEFVYPRSGGYVYPPRRVR